MTGKSAKRILFLYPDPPGFSGQRRAAELMLEVLEDSNSYYLLPVKLPGLPKTGGGILAYWKFATSTIISFITIIWHSLFAGLNGGFIALCQTRSTLIREHFLIRLIRLLSRQPRLPFGFRLDGSNFTAWSGDETVAAKFRRVLSEGKFVSVLGPTQKKIIDEKYQTKELQAIIVPNTCEFDAISDAQISTKHQNGSTLNVLHLSSLMEPKGYIDLVEAIESSDENVSFVVCGKITSTQYDQRFSSVAEASQWLEKQSETKARLTWVQGAYGKEKHKLFMDSHVFVMPTDYPVEAQPLVLLEAMACGCAIVTTAVGEIPFMVDESCAIIIDKRCSTEIDGAISRLNHDRELGRNLALAGRERFLTVFSMQQNLENWRKAFELAYGNS